MASWDHLGDAASLAQFAGLDAVKLIGLIVKAANTARRHKKNCRQFASHVELIGDLLEPLRISELRKYPEIRKPLEQLEGALSRAYTLVNSCQHRSCLYLLAMGWHIADQFREAEKEIDRYLKMVPLMNLVYDARVRERLEDIEKDQHEYTLDDEDKMVQDVIMKPEPLKTDTIILERTLSCSYPNLSFNEALQKENEKLQLELQLSQSNDDVGQCKVIRRLLDMTEAAAANTLQENSSKEADASGEKNLPFGDSSPNVFGSQTTPRNTSSASSEKDLLLSRGSHGSEEQHTDLLGCCSKLPPYIKRFFFTCGTSIKRCFRSCGTFSKTATGATNRRMCKKAKSSYNTLD